MKMRRAATFYDPEEAFCANGFLQSHGIYSVLNNANHLAVAPHLRIALGGYELHVPEESVAEARQLLGQAQAAFLSPTKDNTPAPLCTNCGSADLYRMRHWLWVPIALNYAIPFIPKKRKRKCRSCGHVMAWG